MRRFGRRLLRVAFGLLVLLLVSVLALLVFSQTPTFRTWLLREVVTRVNQTLAGEVSIGGLEGNLVSGLVLTDLRVTLDGVRVLAARRIAANYDLLALVVSRRVVLRDAEVDALVLQLIEDEHGWNVARLVKTEEEQEEETGRSAEIVIESLRVRGGAVRVIRPAEVWRVRRLALDADVAIGGDTQRFRVTDVSFELPGRGVQLAHLEGSVEVGDDGSVALDGLVLRTGASELTAEVRAGATDLPAYDVDVVIKRLAIAELRGLAPAVPLRTDVSGTLRAKGPPSAVVLDADLATAAGSVALDGTIDVASERQGYDLRLTARHVNAAGLLGPAQPETDVNGTISINGTGTTFEEAAATFAVALEASTIAGRPLQRAAVDGTVTDRRVRFTASVLTPSGAAESSGTVDVPGEDYDIRLSTRDFDPSPFLNRPELAARVNGTVTLAGTGFTPKTARAEAHVELARSRVGAVEIREAAATARAANGRLTIERLMLRSNAVDANASGTLGFVETRARDASLRYELESRDLRPVAALAGAGRLAGSLRVTGTAQGSLDALRVDATVTARKLAREGTKLGAVDATVGAAGIGGAAPRAEVTARATDVHVSGQTLKQVDLRARWEQASAKRATAAFDVRAAGAENESHALVGSAVLGAEETRVELETVRLDLDGDTWTATGRPTIVQRGDQLTLQDLTLRSPRGVVRLEGRAGTKGTQDVTLTVEGLELARFGRALGEGIEGRLGLRAHLSGTGSAPRIDADVTIAKPTLGGVSYESVGATLQAGGGRAAIDARLVQIGPRALTLAATVPLRFALRPFAFEVGDRLSGTLRANAIDLGFLDPMLPQVSKLAGTLDADLALGGTMRAPDVRGPITIANGRAYVVTTGLTYDPIELRARAEGQAVTVETIRIVSGNGSLAGGGGAGLEGEQTSMDVRIKLDRFPLFANEYGRSTASGWMWISGTSAAPVIEGALESNGLVLQIPEHRAGAVRPPDPTIKVIGPDASTPAPQPVTRTETTGKGEDDEKPAQKLGVFDGAAITLQIDVPRDAWIRRSDANIELRGWMTVWKKPSEPLSIAGEINAVRGWYSFQGKKFTITEGQVIFTGQDFDPVLRLIATHKAGDYTVRVIVGGRMTKPTLTLESEPSLDQADILAVLLFGKPAGDLNQSESSGLREQAIGIAGSYVASELRQSVSNALGVDNLEFDTGGEGLSNAQVSLGKYVAEDIFVSLSHKFGKQAVEEIRIEYTITPSWSVETSTDTLGDSGIDVFWKRRY